MSGAATGGARACPPDPHPWTEDHDTPGGHCCFCAGADDELARRVRALEAERLRPVPAPPLNRYQAKGTGT